ncbi:hypothetical protein C9374_012830 [Naegleria lovaniensis]|uniref:Uncharacterized protein n=1 Tax=Naegleria lovaniensis TaxID=51637 RepID=A0AA88KC91_NAELO|nr:uncharacterized protein C9374_012830 [Naegleria lovaniensis]KAG2373098.1 hypothetical protein C9374_012830 [Naegleria lovaniensis]
MFAGTTTITTTNDKFAILYKNITHQDTKILTCAAAPSSREQNSIDLTINEMMNLQQPFVFCGPKDHRNDNQESSINPYCSSVPSEADKGKETS